MTIDPGHVGQFLAGHLNLILSGVAGVAVLVLLVSAVRRAGVVTFAVTVAALIGIGASIEGMWAFAGHILGLVGVWRFIPAVLFESAMVASAARAAAHHRDHGHTGRYGSAIWGFALVAGAVTALNGHSAAECLFRLAAPMVAAAVWYQGFAGAGRRPGAISWRLTPRRLLVRLGFAEPGERDVIEIDRDRRVAALAVTAHRLHHGGHWLRWWHAARLRRLALGADDDMVSEARIRVARVHHIEALTAPDSSADTPAGGDSDTATDTGADSLPDTDRGQRTDIRHRALKSISGGAAGPTVEQLADTLRAKHGRNYVGQPTALATLKSVHGSCARGRAIEAKKLHNSRMNLSPNGKVHVS